MASFHELIKEAQKERQDKPLSERLKKDTKLHQAIVQFLTDRMRASHDALAERFDEWETVDDHFRMYIDLSKGRRTGEQERSTEDEAMPHEYGLVMPVTFASLMVRASQAADVFINRDPVIEYGPTGAEDVRGSQLMSAVMQYDANRMGFVNFIWQALMNAEKYGISPCFDEFFIDHGRKIVPPRVDPADMPAGVPSDESLSQAKTIWGRRTQHCMWHTLDPRNYWPDPDYAVGDVQKPWYTFCGHRVYRSIFWFLERKLKDADDVEGYFNVDELQKMRERGTAHGDQGSSAQYIRKETAPGYHGRSTVAGDQGHIPLDRLEVKIVPRELALGKADKPEIWVFELADERVLVKAMPLKHWHGHFSYTVGEVLPDSASFSNHGYGTLAIGMQEYMNWMFSAYLEEVSRRIVNKLAMVPEVWEMEDLERTEAGWPLRTNEYGSEQVLEMGRNLQEFYRQLEMPSQSQDLMHGAYQVWDMLKLAFSTSDPQLSRPLPTKRTLGEVERVMSAGTQRVAITVRLLEDQLLRPLAEKAAGLRQQYTEDPQWVRITGVQAEALGQRPGPHKVKRADLWGSYDYEPLLGTRPTDPASTAQTWLQIMQAMRSSPEMLQVMGPTIIGELAKSMGIKNFDEMASRAKIQMVPDEAIQSGREAGDYATEEEVQR